MQHLLHIEVMHPYLRIGNIKDVLFISTSDGVADFIVVVGVCIIIQCQYSDYDITLCMLLSGCQCIVLRYFLIIAILFEFGSMFISSLYSDG